MLYHVYGAHIRWIVELGVTQCILFELQMVTELHMSHVIKDFRDAK